MPETLLTVEKLHKRYGDFEALRDISFVANRGELVCIVGPSGCGKTTLLKIVAGLLAPTSGTVELDGTRVTGPHRRMAVVFQEYGRSLMPWMTVRGNVELPLRSSMSKAQRREASQTALEAVGLGQAAHKFPWQLSGGMQQRVAIARAIAYRPRLLLMDEPFASVDAQTRSELEDLVLRIRKEFDMTILFVTHDIDESVYLAHRVLVLSKPPATLVEDIEVRLPEPRDQITTKEDETFVHLRAHVARLIRSEKAGSSR